MPTCRSNTTSFPPEVLFRGILDQLSSRPLLMQSFDGEPAARAALENDRRAALANEVMGRWPTARS